MAKRAGSKRLFACVSCQIPKRFSDTFKCRVEKVIELYPGQHETRLLEGRLCLDCAEKAGYKIRRKRG